MGNVEVVDLSERDLHNLDTVPIPMFAEELICSHNRITTIKNLPIFLDFLDCSHNQLKSIRLPTNLSLLIADHNDLETLKLPANLNILKCRRNKLQALLCPPKLRILSCSNNLIRAIKFSETLTKIDISHNKLTSLPDLPTTSLKQFLCNNNLLTYLPEIPTTLTRLVTHSNNFASDNRIITFPTLKELSIIAILNKRTFLDNFFGNAKHKNIFGLYEIQHIVDKMKVCGLCGMKSFLYPVYLARHKYIDNLNRIVLAPILLLRCFECCRKLIGMLELKTYHNLAIKTNN